MLKALLRGKPGGEDIATEFIVPDDAEIIQARPILVPQRLVAGKGSKSCNSIWDFYARYIDAAKS